MTPEVFVLPLFIPAWLIAGRELFSKHTPYLDAHPGLMMMLAAIVAVELILRIWSYAITCSTVAEVQGYRSAWRGLGTVLLAGLVVSAALMVLILILLIPIIGGTALLRLVHG
jgi:hypothetical protein